MPYLLSKLASLISYGLPLIRLRLRRDCCLSLSAYIYSFIKLALLVACATANSLSVYGLNCAVLDLRM